MKFNNISSSRFDQFNCVIKCREGKPKFFLTNHIYQTINSTKTLDLNISLYLGYLFNGINFPVLFNSRYIDYVSVYVRCLCYHFNYESARLYNNWRKFGIVAIDVFPLYDTFNSFYQHLLINCQPSSLTLNDCVFMRLFHGQGYILPVKCRKRRRNKFLVKKYFTGRSNIFCGELQSNFKLKIIQRENWLLTIKMVLNLNRAFKEPWK